MHQNILYICTVFIRQESRPKLIAHMLRTIPIFCTKKVLLLPYYGLEAVRNFYFHP